MYTGVVVWFRPQLGFGFLRCDNLEKEIFCHWSAIEMDGYKSLREGQTVEFSIVDGPKGKQAGSVRVVK